MVIVDFSSVIIANLHAQFGIQNIKVVEEDLLRHMILNTLRAIRIRFKKQDMVIACDRGTWRKSVYPYYKANRKKAKDESGLDWKAIFQVFGKIRAEIRENFPYRVIEVEGAEADDVIASLVFEFGDKEGLIMGLSDGAEEIVIVSPDKDFAQLHLYPNVKQFDPIKKKFITHKEPAFYLREHILRGDSGDGVPNVLSDDDTFVVPEKRQKPMTAKRLEDMLLNGVPEEYAKNFERNSLMIDLRNSPESIRQEVLDTYKQQAGKDRSKIFNYMVQNRLRNLLESIQEF